MISTRTIYIGVAIMIYNVGFSLIFPDNSLLIINGAINITMLTIIAIINKKHSNNGK